MTQSSVASKKGMPPLLLALIPLVLIAVMVLLFVQTGSRIFPGNAPPVEELTVGRVDLEPGNIRITVINGGPTPITISQVLIDEAYWQFSIEPSDEIGRLKTATLEIPYQWNAGDPIEIKMISSSGIVFSHSIEVSAESPEPNARFLWTFGLLGIYIGLIPVVLGMTAMPFLRTLDRKWIAFFMALTAGVLVFLGVETAVAAIDQANTLAGPIGGIGLVALGIGASFGLILAGARVFKNRSGGDKRIVVAWLVAAGIGLHNLGEGLAVGAAWRLGQITLGAFLVIGFAIHNTTEGIGIVSVISDRKPSLWTLAGLGAIAGVPTVFGTWVSAFFFSPTLAAAFLAIATGAIAEVVFEVLEIVKEEAGSIAAPAALVGISVGLAIMYVTGLFVAA